MIVILNTEAKPDNGIKLGAPLSVTVAVIVCTPNDSAEVENPEPVVSWPSTLEDQTILAVMFPSSKSDAVAANVRLVPVTKEVLSPGDVVMITVGAVLTPAAASLTRIGSEVTISNTWGAGPFGTPS